MTDHEKFVDEEIAPELLRLAKLCEQRGISFISCVQYGPDDTLETCTMPAHPGIRSLLAYWGVKSHGNVDSFFMAASKYARLHGHGSMVLRMMGVSETPAKTEAD